MDPHDTSADGSLRPLMLRKLLQYGPLLLIALMSIAAQAAPVGEETTEVPSPVDARLPPPPRESTEGKKTVDLLLEMQPRAAGLEFKERRLPQRGEGEGGSNAGRQTALPSRPGAIEAAEHRPPASTVPPSGLFGSGATNPAAATPRADAHRTHDVAQTEAWRPNADRAPAGGRGDPAASSGLVRLWILPREVIDYVRENREWFIGGIALALAALWIRSGGLARRH